MKRSLHRLAALLLCLSLALACLVLSVGATKPSRRHTPITWSLSGDLTDLLGSGKHYERYYANGAFYDDATRSFTFMNSVVYDGRYCTVRGDALDPHIVSVETETGYSTVYVDDVGKAILDAFLNGSDVIYYLEEFGDELYTVLEGTLVSALDAAHDDPASEHVTVDVTQLAEAEIHEVTAHDPTETKAYQHGAVYKMSDGTYLYVCFRDLDNTHFDADGYFSYRAGSVDANVLSGALLEVVTDAIDEQIPREREYLYEYGVVNGYYDENGNPLDVPDDFYGDAESDRISIAFFYVTTILFGILLPAGAIVLGLVLARPKRTGRAVHWYGLVAASGLLVLASALLLLTVSL